MKIIRNLLKIMLRLWIFVGVLQLSAATWSMAATNSRSLTESTEPASIITDNNTQILLETFASDELRLQNEDKELIETSSTILPSLLMPLVKVESSGTFLDKSAKTSSVTLDKTSSEISVVTSSARQTATSLEKPTATFEEKSPATSKDLATFLEGSLATPSATFDKTSLETGTVNSVPTIVEKSLATSVSSSTASSSETSGEKYSLFSVEKSPATFVTSPSEIATSLSKNSLPTIVAKSPSTSVASSTAASSETSGEKYSLFSAEKSSATFVTSPSDIVESLSREQSFVKKSKDFANLTPLVQSKSTSKETSLATSLETSSDTSSATPLIESKTPSSLKIPSATLSEIFSATSSATSSESSSATLPATSEKSLATSFATSIETFLENFSAASFKKPSATFLQRSPATFSEPMSKTSSETLPATSEKSLATSAETSLEKSSAANFEKSSETFVPNSLATFSSQPSATFPSTSHSPSTSTSFSTVASSNAPATITNQAKHIVTTKTLDKEETDTEEDKNMENYEKISNMNNDDIENAEKQVITTTESVLEQKQQQQQIKMDAVRKKETDIHKQSTGNARKTDKNLYPATEINTAATEKQLTTIQNTLDTTTKAARYAIEEENPITSTNTPTPHTIQTNEHFVKQEQHNNDDVFQQQHSQVHLKQTENVDLKHYTATTTQIPPAIATQPSIANTNTQEIDSFTLTLDTLAKDKQAREDFKPIIEDANEKLLKERTIFSQKPLPQQEEWKQNLMPNEVDYDEDKRSTSKVISKTYEHNINWSPYLHPATPVTDFTGKLLQEQDGVITEIEQKFRLNEYAGEMLAKPTKNPKTSPSLNKPQPKELLLKSFTVNHEILKINKNPVIAKTPVEFIERRVKKSFDFPMHRVASDALHMPQHFDFANTKFNSNNNDPLTQAAISQGSLNNGQHMDNLQQIRPQPEFSTTKFYNSKELYNEMLQHKSNNKPAAEKFPQQLNLKDKEIQELNNRPASLSLNSFAVLHSPKVAKLEEIHDLKDITQQKQQQKQQQQPQKTLEIKKVTVTAAKQENKELSYTTSKSPTTTITTTSSSSSTTTTEIPLAPFNKTKKFQKELNRAKLLIKTMMPLQNSTISTATVLTTLPKNNEEFSQPPHIKTSNFNSLSSTNKQNSLTSSASSPLSTLPQHFSKEISSNAQSTQSSSSLTPTSSPSTITTLRPFVSVSSSSSSSSSTSTNPPKSSVKPIVRPRILSRLQEKINSLECELQNLPQDSHLWRGNETHELLLPIMTPENCKTDKDCTAMMVSWEGEAEIQSGDILIVEINDALLTPKDINLTTSAHNTQVYQVTRSGHEHCDVTEGILLDITPLIVDGRKLVTLYDKDLTEGVNLLIVVSELWGSQCVRLKVTTKTENCGENADCSGKGICYSNYDMEEYECQCCSGFAGPHCEEIDACTPSPCTNNGICVDLSQGHEGNSYQCLCPYGYTGKNCQYELDPCNPAECMNGGSCVGNSTHFRCECTPGFAGPLCQHSLNECESSPCIHGICVDQEDGFRCFCQPGFAGELCNFEYNECESNPCQNSGECIDHIGSYECHCTKGYTGNRCQIKVDFCANKPCPEGRRCIDHGNDYSCECLGGRNGPDCNEMQRTQCNVNPCTHGGTCWSSGDSFYCACRPGYTGTMCEDEFVVETVVSSSEFMVDDTSARNFNDKSFSSSVVLKSPIELHNAYTAAIVLALVIFFVALYLTICHCKVNQTYRKFSTRTYGFLPILGFRLRTKQATSKISRHWLSGKGLSAGGLLGGGGGSAAGATMSTQHTTTSSQRNSVGHLPTANASSNTQQQQQQTHVGQLNERPFQRHLAMNLENDMYYTVDFSENSQHSPLIK